jgi:hypothetical protein
VPLICPTAQGKYFSLRDWTTQISLNRLTKIAFRRTRFWRLSKARSIRRWGNGPRSAVQASRAGFGAIDGALRAACLEGGRSSLTMMV